MSAYSFKGNSTISEMSFNEVLKDNVISFIDWGFLQLGAFFNITIPSSGAYGGNEHVLRPVVDPRYTDGQVWEGFRQNWVWQSGMSCSEQPISISGIFVDNVFVPKSGNTYYVNYPDGQIVFNTAINTSSTVKLEYSPKWVDVIDANNIPWFREVQTRSFRLDEDTFTQGSGIWNKLSETRVQLPTIAVEFVDKSYAGYQLGGSQYVFPIILLHVLAEDDSTANRISTILSEQSEKTFFMYDTNLLASNNAFPLDYNGDLISNPLSYPDLVAPTGTGGYRYTSRIKNGTICIKETTEQSHGSIINNVYHNTVRWNMEAISFKI